MQLSRRVVDKKIIEVGLGCRILLLLFRAAMT